MNPFRDGGTVESHFWPGRELILTDDEPLAIITLWQPWASLIAYGLKRYETRSWPTRFRGKLAIHAAVKWDAENLPHVRHWAMPFAENGVRAEDLPRGAIVALTSLEEMHKTVCLEPHIDRREFRAGDWAQGRWAWELGAVERYREPIRWKGSQGLKGADYPLRKLLGAGLVDNRTPRR